MAVRANNKVERVVDVDRKLSEILVNGEGRINEDQAKDVAELQKLVEKTYNGEKQETALAKIRTFVKTAFFHGAVSQGALTALDPITAKLPDLTLIEGRTMLRNLVQMSGGKLTPEGREVALSRIVANGDVTPDEWEIEMEASRTSGPIEDIKATLLDPSPALIEKRREALQALESSSSEERLGIIRELVAARARAWITQVMWLRLLEEMVGKETFELVVSAISRHDPGEMDIWRAVITDAVANPHLRIPSTPGKGRPVLKALDGEACALVPEVIRLLVTCDRDSETTDVILKGLRAGFQENAARIFDIWMAQASAGLGDSST